MKTTKVSAVAIACLLTLTAVACGSKKSSDTSASGNGASAEKQSDTAGTASSGNSDNNNGSSSSNDTSLAAGLGALGSAGDCLQTSLAYASLILEPLGFASGASQSDIDNFEQQVSALKAKIPDEIKPEFQTVADAYQAYGDELKTVNLGDILNPDTQQKLQDASDKIDSPDVKAAQDKIDAYFKNNCGQ